MTINGGWRGYLSFLGRMSTHWDVSICDGWGIDKSDCQSLSDGALPG